MRTTLKEALRSAEIVRHADTGKVLVDPPTWTMKVVRLNFGMGRRYLLDDQEIIIDREGNASIQNGDEEIVLFFGNEVGLRASDLPSKPMETNEDLLHDLMNYSPFGALAQGFIMEAIMRRAETVAASKPEDYPPGSMFNPQAWIGVAADIKQRCDAFYGRHEGKKG